METEIYNLGLNSRMPFINTKSYLEINFGEGKYSGEREVESGINVPVHKYSSNGLKVNLVGNGLVDIRYFEIKGERNDITKFLRELRKNKIKFGLMNN